jgi:hypothetical protein
LRAAVSKRSSLVGRCRLTIISPLGADREGDSVKSADGGNGAESAISPRARISIQI